VVASQRRLLRGWLSGRDGGGAKSLAAMSKSCLQRAPKAKSPTNLRWATRRMQIIRTIYIKNTRYRHNEHMPLQLVVRVTQLNCATRCVKLCPLPTLHLPPPNGNGQLGRARILSHTYMSEGQTGKLLEGEWQKRWQKIGLVSVPTTTQYPSRYRKDNC